MSARKRVSDLEKATGVGHIAITDEERVQVLRPGESVEERRAAVKERFGTEKGVLFVRIKGMDG